MFLSTFGRESRYKRPRWLAEFERGNWYVGRIGDQNVAMMGVTRDPRTGDRYVEYMWVLPNLRGSGFAGRMLSHAEADLLAAGVSTLYLWVLDGNDIAKQVYKNKGFDDTGLSQPVVNRPGLRPNRTEHQMEMPLTR